MNQVNFEDLPVDRQLDWIVNQFCATGEGGGIDASCSPGKGGGGGGGGGGTGASKAAKERSSVAERLSKDAEREKTPIAYGTAARAHKSAADVPERDGSPALTVKFHRTEQAKYEKKRAEVSGSARGAGMGRGYGGKLKK